MDANETQSSAHRAPEAARVARLLTDSTAVSLRRARKQIARAGAEAGLRPEAVREMEVAAGEALSNVNRHAYPSRIGLVFIDMFRADESVSVTVMDLGVATHALEVPTSPPSRPLSGGRGLYLMGLLADGVQIRVNQVGHGLTVTITKSLKPREIAA